MKCEKCREEMNPAEAMLGPVCGKCARKAHAKAVGPAAKPRRAKTKRWTFWIIGWDDGPTHEGVKSTSVKWPNTVFENLAKQRGFTKLVRDQTVVGGYFANPDTGDALVCLPYGEDPKKYY